MVGIETDYLRLAANIIPQAPSPARIPMNGTGDLVGVGTGDGDISTVRSTVLPVEIVMAPDQSLYPTFWRRMV